MNTREWLKGIAGLWTLGLAVWAAVGDLPDLDDTAVVAAFVWAVGMLMLAAAYGLSRAPRRCPVCDRDVATGVTRCEACSHNFRPRDDLEEERMLVAEARAALEAEDAGA